MPILSVSCSLFLFIVTAAGITAFHVTIPHSKSSTKYLLVGKGFDFSSTIGWEEYYQCDDSVIEWHFSIPLEVIADLVPIKSTCLVVGCGNSHLPRVIYNRREPLSLACLDSSQTCLDQLQQRDGASCPRMTFLLGNAVKLTKVLHGINKYDSIVDKGLLDALMCGEGWNDPIAQLLDEVGQVLRTGGTYLLVCYKLSSATREFLEQVGSKAGLSWIFDLEGSNDRVSISIACKII